MQIALLGGTGDVGEGLALRWGRDSDHALLIGSRDRDRATDAADRYADRLADLGVDAAIEGRENPAAAAAADVTVLSVPPYHVADTVSTVADDLADGAVLVSPAVGMQSDEHGLHYHRPSAGSVTAVAADAAPSTVSVVGAFHSLSAEKLTALEEPLEQDTLLVGDDPDAKDTVAGLAEDIEGLRPLDAGPLANAPEVESLTPLLINLARYNETLSDVGVSFS